MEGLGMLNNWKCRECGAENSPLGLLLVPSTEKETSHMLAVRADEFWQKLRGYTSAWRRRGLQSL
jgi:hypothetical protein